MRNSFLQITTSILLFSFLQTSYGFAQVGITGPSCVVIGTEYQYDFTKEQSDSSNIQVCLTGGIIARTDSICRDARFFSFMRVIWTDTAQGIISLRTSHGNDSIVVDMTKALQGGKINPMTAFQMMKADSIPGAIVCSEAVGGSCMPSYNYEWQQSADGMGWQVLPSSTSKNLELQMALVKTTYYRRKVIETISGSESFSDVAVIMLTAATIDNP